MFSKKGKKMAILLHMHTLGNPIPTRKKRGYYYFFNPRVSYLLQVWRKEGLDGEREANKVIRWVKDGLTPKGPNCVFWQHSDFGQVLTNGVFIFFL